MLWADFIPVDAWLGKHLDLFGQWCSWLSDKLQLASCARKVKESFAKSTRPGSQNPRSG